jgi:hypothetical protein
MNQLRASCMASMISSLPTSSTYLFTNALAST